MTNPVDTATLFWEFHPVEVAVVLVYASTEFPVPKTLTFADGLYPLATAVPHPIEIEPPLPNCFAVVFVFVQAKLRSPKAEALAVAPASAPPTTDEAIRSDTSTPKNLSTVLSRRLTSTFFIRINRYYTLLTGNSLNLSIDRQKGLFSNK